MDNSMIGATTFDVSFTPDNSSLAFNIDGVSTINGNVTGMFQIIKCYLTEYSYSPSVCIRNVGP